MPAPALNLVAVTDLADPRLADYATMRDAELRHRAQGESPGGRFMAEGELVVRRLIDSPYRPLSVLLTPTRLETLRDALERLLPGTPVYLADQRLMNSVVGFNMHRGVLASARRGPATDPATLWRRCRVLVGLEGLTNHDNVGGIFRSAAALAGPSAGVFLSPGCCDPLYRKSIRVSMGHALRIPFATLNPWPGGLASARHPGFAVIALTPAPDAVPIGDVRLGPGVRPLLLLGAEGPGLTPGALTAADHRVRIPTSPDVDSLNVGTAAAIALHRLTGPDVS
jgi:tRNA G18 (ribose-2'-O)-methylase SpoU